MKLPRSDAGSLRRRLQAAGDLRGLFLWDSDRSAALSSPLQASYLRGALNDLTGRSVLLATKHQLATALALIELDGIARRLVICPYDVPLDQLAAIIADADIDAIVSDRGLSDFRSRMDGRLIEPGLQPTPIEGKPEAGYATEWVLLTSGTTGIPKLVVHSLDGLTGAFRDRAKADPGVVWATFYDIRRYGGLQIFLRSMLAPSSLVLSHTDEPLGEHIRRLVEHGVTHVSGTPTHWRRAIMSPAAKQFRPQYIRLSGEIADQAILDALANFWPDARIGHAYASTEAGVGFEVVDGREGFPATYLDGGPGQLQMKIEGGSLRIRSNRAASGYLGASAAPLAGDDGFVDTGDMIEQVADRCYFRGRRGGVINVGGAKVHPEEVEAVINRHAKVRMSLVKSRHNPITGGIVIAEVVLAPEAGVANDPAATEQEILQLCRTHLARHKVPALIRFVPALHVTGGGKLERRHA